MRCFKVYRRAGIRVVWVLLLLFNTAVGAQAVQVYTVGNQSSCTFTELQAALDAAAGDYPSGVTIRVNGNVEVTDPPLLVQGAQVTLEGGYFDCGSDVRAGTTDLSARGEDRVFVVDRSSTDPDRLTRLTLRDIQVLDGSAFNGAGIQIKGRSTVELVDSNVIGNVATLRGGGVEVLGGSTLMIFGGSRIAANLAGRQGGSGQGGGVYCGDSFGAVFLIHGAEIGSNQAVRDGDDPARGGGLYLTGNCHFVMSGGATVARNRADEGGGGYLEGQSTAQLTSSVNDGLIPSFDNNRVTAAGGALYVTGGSEVTMNGGAFVDNDIVPGASGVIGGALFLTEGSTFQGMAAPPESPDCPHGPTCSRFVGNQADSGPLAVVGERSTLRLQGVLLAGNAGPDGALVKPHFGGARVELTDNFIVHNPVSHLLSSADGSAAIFRHNTIADNPGLESVLFAEVDSVSLEFSNNLIMEGGAPVFAGPGRFDEAVWECHVGSSAQAVPFDRQVTIDVADFVDPANLDYHLGPDSGAIDACDGPLFDPERLDIDGELRPVDLAAVSGSFYADAGADEARGAIERRRLAISIDGPGRVFHRDGLVDCPGTCEAEFHSLRKVKLEAQPQPGVRTIWETECVDGGGDSCTVFMDGDQLVTVRFAPLRSVSVQVQGPGRVEGNHGIACPPSDGHACDVEVVQGETVRLEAIPEAAGIFTGWEDACAFAGTDPVCELIAEFPLEIRAGFVIDQQDILFSDRFEMKAR